MQLPIFISASHLPSEYLKVKTNHVFGILLMMRKGCRERNWRIETLQPYHYANLFTAHNSLSKSSQVPRENCSNINYTGFFFPGYLATAGHSLFSLVLVKPSNMCFKEDQSGFLILRKERFLLQAIFSAFVPRIILSEAQLYKKITNNQLWLEKKAEYAWSSGGKGV